MPSERLVTAVAAVVLTGAAVAGGYRVQVGRHAAASAWKHADADGDGVALWHERDADGDGMVDLDDADADGDGVDNPGDIAQAARALSGGLADPLMGKYANLLGRVGFVVCTDVVVEAWLAAGISLPAVLGESAVSQPAWFTFADGNGQDDPYFPRRVRNFADLFGHHARLDLSADPRAGDIAFYGRNHAAIVVERFGSGYAVVEAYGPVVKQVAGSEVERREGVRGVFGRIR